MPRTILHDREARRARRLQRDGKHDLLLFNKVTGQVREWILNGLTRQANLLVGTQADLGYRPAGTGDYDGNGKSDLLWQHQTTHDVFFWLNGTSTPSAVGTSPAGSSVAGSGDYDGNGSSDILWRNMTTGEVTVWLLTGGTVTNVGTVGTLAPPWQTVTSGDFDNDGRSDIFWQNRTTGATRIWFMGGLATVSRVASTTRADMAWRVFGTGDYNNDKKADLVWFTQPSSATGPDIWIMNGATVASTGHTSASAPSGAAIATTGDINGNGVSDIVWLSPSLQVTGWIMSARTVQSQGVIANLPSSDWTIVRTQQ